jgi:hypothetical protein
VYRLSRRWDRKYWATYKVLDILQKVFYRSNPAREAFVEMCEDSYVQKMTFDSYLYKTVVPGGCTGLCCFLRIVVTLSAACEMNQAFKIDNCCWLAAEQVCRLHGVSGELDGKSGFACRCLHSTASMGNR